MHVSAPLPCLIPALNKPRFFFPPPLPNGSPPHAVKKSRQTIKGMKPSRVDEFLAGSENQSPRCAFCRIWYPQGRESARLQLKLLRPCGYKILQNAHSALDLDCWIS